MGNSSAKLLLIGLDNSGKSTILSRIIDPDVGAHGITPTIGYKKEIFTRNGIDFEVMDMSGESKYRDLWQSNATNSDQKDQIHGIIFVVDSSDRMRVRVAKSELDLIVENRYISDKIPFLVYANKNDVKGACTLEDMRELLELNKLRREYQIFSCSALTGKGIQEGIGWLSTLIKIKFEATN